MIRSLTLRNFKCFAEQRVAFAPLTLLVGANASGKSSVIQSLLVLRQSHRRSVLRDGTLLLNGRLANIGTIIDVFSQTPLPEPLSNVLSLILEVNSGQISDFTFRRSSDDAQNRSLHGTASPGYETLNLFLDRFNYLNAERLGPKLLFPLPEDDRDPYDIGIHGEYAAHIVSRDQQDLLSNEPLAYYDEETGEISRTLLNQTRYWMRQIIPNFDLKLTPVPGGDQVQALFGNIPGQELVRPSNIGFGLIYTLPIVVAALVAPAGSLLIVENPEAHLHPRSQSIMGRFLARVAAAGVQLIVETHSDHILNGVRVAVRRGAWDAKIQADDVSIQYFMPGDGDRPYTVRQPRLYEDGGIDPWPQGFFDQMDLDLRELL